MLFDQETEERYTPLNELGGEQAAFEVVNSMLSEEAVLGFEYGYSLAEPKALTLWEAQFGDFANGAQVVIDQFISSGERKWLRMSGLVMLLPHGYEGQGPEHSSARLERYLQSCAEDNMQVANCTTPSNYFHVLRRQMHRNFRKPLILMTPKSLLRHKRAVSRLDEMAEGSTFHRLLYDDAEMLKGEKIELVPDEKMRRVVICSGKVYFDLYEERENRGIRRHLPAARRAALSLPAEGDGRSPVALPGRRGGLVPGRAAEHGRLDLRRAAALRGARRAERRQAHRALCRAAGLGFDRDRPHVEAHCAAQRSDRGSARLSGVIRATRRERPMALEIKVPTLGESVTEATVGQWLKKEGDAVARDEPLVELETDKVTLEVPAPAAGRLEKIAVKDGETVGVGALLGMLAEGEAGAEPQPKAEAKKGDGAKAPAAAAAEPAKGGMPPAPAAQKLMAERGISADDVAGSGKRGQILKGDVLAALERVAKAPEAPPPAGRARRAPPPTRSAKSG